MMNTAIYEILHNIMSDIESMLVNGDNIEYERTYDDAFICPL